MYKQVKAKSLPEYVDLTYLIYYCTDVFILLLKRTSQSYIL